MSARCRNGCILCTGPQPGHQVFATFALLIREAASCRTLFIQRYAWRVEYSGSSTITSTGPIFAAHWTAVPSDIPQSQEAVFRHLLTEHDQPSPYISLSTSLMWALSFAHTKNRQGFHSIRIYLIDTRKLGLAWPYRVWPAVLYIAYLQLQRLDYSNTGHNYLVEGKIPLEAILGLVPIEFDGIRFRDERLRTILPALSETPPEEHPVLLASLERCRKPFTSSQKHDITLTHMHAAFELAYGLLRGGSEHTARDRLAITIMLLALMPRNWPAGRLLLRRFFDGVKYPQDYRLHMNTILINPQMVDQLEYFQGMLHVDNAPPQEVSSAWWPGAP